MFRSAIYLKPTPDQPSVATDPSGGNHLRTAIALLRHVGDPRADLIKTILDRSMEHGRTMSHADADLIVPVLNGLGDQLQNANLIDHHDVLDSATVTKLRSEDVGRHLDFAPERGDDARYAVSESLGNIVGVAQLLERAVAENLIIVLS